MSTITILGAGGMATAIAGLSAKAGQGRPLYVFIAGDDAQAKARVAVFVESIGLRPMDIGLLPMARTLEHICLLSLRLLAQAIKHTNLSI